MHLLLWLWLHLVIRLIALKSLQSFGLDSYPRLLSIRLLITVVCQLSLLFLLFFFCRLSLTQVIDLQQPGGLPFR